MARERSTAEIVQKSQQKLRKFVAWAQTELGESYQTKQKNIQLRLDNEQLRAENQLLKVKLAELEAQLAATSVDGSPSEITVPHPDHPDVLSRSATMTIENAIAKLSFFYLGSMTPTCTAELRRDGNGILQGYFVQVSPELCALLGYTEEELLSQPFTNFMCEEDRQPAIDAMAQMQAAYQGGKPAKIVDFRNIYLHKDGHEVHMRWRSQYQLSTGLTFAQVADDTKVVQLAEEQAREELLHSIVQFILPPAVITRIRELGLDVNNLTNYSETLPAAILFADIVKFSTKCQGVNSSAVTQSLGELDVLVSKLATHYGVYIVKTVGDCYIAISGAPVVKKPKAAAYDMLQFAHALHQIAQQVSIGQHPVEFRIGIHFGDINCTIKHVDGRFTFDIFGEAVNYAARMEQHGVDGCIQVSEAFYQHVQDQAVVSEQTEVEIKGYDEHAPVKRLANQEQELEFLSRETSSNVESEKLLQLFFNTITRSQIGKIVHQLVSDFLTPRRDLIAPHSDAILAIATKLETCNLKAAAIDLRNLVENPDDITAEHITRKTDIDIPVSAAEFFNHLQQVEYAGLVSQNLNDQTLAHLAVALNSDNALEKIIASGEQFDNTDLQPALSWGASLGRELMVTKLCSSKPTLTNLNAALHCACEAGHLHIMKILVISGANINNKDSNKQRLLTKLIQSRNVDILDWILAQQSLTIKPADLKLLQATEFDDHASKQKFEQTMIERLNTSAVSELRTSRSTPVLRRSSSESDIAAAHQLPQPLATASATAFTLWEKDAKQHEQEAALTERSEATGGYQHG